MKVSSVGASLSWAVLVTGVSLLAPARALAHCDSLDGPVVKAAQVALATRNVTAVLVWVQANDEPEIRSAFEQALAVRALSPQAAELADRFFFETLVRVHRAGEGAPYTGLKPAGRDLGRAISAADEALEAGAAGQVAKLLADTMLQGLRERFNEALTTRAFEAGDVAAGREYVRAYVAYIHYVERLYEAAAAGSHGHVGETERAAHDR